MAPPTERLARVCEKARALYPGADDVRPVWAPNSEPTTFAEVHLPRGRVVLVLGE